jgi:LmbE family N-acetylglucosaminyl deacetylase
MTTNTKPVLLSVLAHPDDESFGMGGTLALYARRGVEVHLICATRGEVGEMDEQFLEGYGSIAERREAELRCATGILGLKEVHFLDYRDSGMPGSADNHHPKALAAAPVEEVASKIAEYIRTIKPHIVLTFDPIGGYRHPDHIAIHKATVLAFGLTGEPTFSSDGLPPYQPQKLYYHTIPRGFLKMLVRLMPLFGQDPRHWGRNKDIDLYTLSQDNFPVHAVINFKPVMDLKDQASACHASQGGGGLSRGLARWLVRLRGNKDFFMRAYPAPQPGRRERDLFEGVNLDEVS